MIASFVRSRPAPPKAPRRRHGRAVPLSDLAPGSVVTVAHVDASDPRRLHKLLALGVLPGCTLELRQRYPAFVFKLGHAQFAVDEQIASAIFVRR